MDIKLIESPATADERAAVDGLLGPPLSQWEGGDRIDPREGHVGYSGAAVRAQRHLLLPALQAVQSHLLVLYTGVTRTAASILKHQQLALAAGRKTLQESGLTLVTGDTMSDAAKKVVQAVA